MDSLFFQEHFVKFSKFFATTWHPVQPVHRVSWCRTLFFGNCFDHISFIQTRNRTPFFSWIPYSSKNILSNFQNFLEPVGIQFNRFIESVGVEHCFLVIVLIISPSSELEIAHHFFSWIPYSFRNFMSNFQKFLQPVHRVSWCRTLILVILEPKSYMARTHKLQISFGQCSVPCSPPWIHMDSWWWSKLKTEGSELASWVQEK